MQNDKETPKKCEATLCCRATAELQAKVEQEKLVADPQGTCCASIDQLVQSEKTKKEQEDANKDS